MCPRRENFGDLLVLDHVGQPVRAEEEPVARDCFGRQRVDLEVGGYPQHPGQHAALGVGGSVVRGDVSRGELFGNDRVVVGDLLELAFVPEIGAAVADVGEADDPIIVQVRPG